MAARIIFANLSQLLALLCPEPLDRHTEKGQVQLGPTQRSWFSSSGVGPENLHFQQFPADADAAGQGTTLWDPMAGPGNCISYESHSLT